MHDTVSIPEVGVRVRGRVVRFYPRGALLEIGAGLKGLLHASQVSWVNKRAKVDELLKIGDELDVVVLHVRRSKKSNAVYISLGYRQTQENPWGAVADKHPVGSWEKATVVDFVPWGAIVEFRSGFRALVHDSEVSWTETRPKATDFLRLGDEIEVVVQRVDKDKRRIHASYRQTQENPWEAAAEKHPAGSQERAKVVDFFPSGAILELSSGFRALVHDSEVSWTETKPKAIDFLRLGDEIEVVVQRVDKDKRQIRASYRQTQQNPWEAAAEKHPVGSREKATVVVRLSYGAIVEFRSGFRALVHSSELSWTEVNPKATEILRLGDEIEVVVLLVDKDKRRIGASYRQTLNNPWLTFLDRFPVGTVTQGTVVSVRNFGVFVMLSNGCTGLLHKTSFPAGRASISLGETVAVAVIAYDHEKQRACLGYAASES